MAPSASSVTAHARLPIAVVAAIQVALAIASSGCVLWRLPDHHGWEALDSGEVVVGAWLGSWPADGNPAIDQFQDKAGVRLDVVDVYLDWNTPFANVSHTLHHIASRGAVPVLTWEPQGLTTVDILDGHKQIPLRDGRRMAMDDYVAEFAEGTCQAAHAAQQPILVRTLHEMNGFWFAWGITWKDGQGHTPNSIDNYRRAWIKVHDAFTNRCGSDVRFVWAVNHFSLGQGATFTNAYPGDAYVDFVAIDGYNWGANANWGWQSFDDIFHDSYCAVTAATTKPLLIAETASTERGGDKAAWIGDMYAKLHSYGRIRGFVWFNDAKYEIESHRDLDWPADSSDAALAAYAAGARAITDGRGSSATPVAQVRC
ncbi:MAG: glycosyl hydrolase [bacterium]